MRYEHGRDHWLRVLGFCTYVTGNTGVEFRIRGSAVPIQIRIRIRLDPHGIRQAAVSEKTRTVSHVVEVFQPNWRWITCFWRRIWLQKTPPRTDPGSIASVRIGIPIAQSFKTGGSVVASVRRRVGVKSGWYGVWVHTLKLQECIVECRTITLYYGSLRLGR
jgi:hypothetical protein